MSRAEEDKREAAGIPGSARAHLGEGVELVDTKPAPCVNTSWLSLGRVVLESLH